MRLQILCKIYLKPVHASPRISGDGSLACIGMRFESALPFLYSSTPFQMSLVFAHHSFIVLQDSDEWCDR